jgi:fructose-1,6-bisphosphatase/inositol monophosphatase family enzyme
MNDHIEVHDFACDIARRAGELQLSRAENVGEIVEKAPKDVVTEVDLLCEKLMVDAIRERFPGDAILSEEQGGEISATGRTWLLDPVDGTANFTKANPMYCACVAVLENGQVTHTAVAAPRIGDLYHARLGSQEPGLQKVLFDSWQLRALGSAGIRGAWLAAGYLDVSVGTRNTAWDYAPTVLLVSEAGGRATDLDGSPWTVDSKGLIATNGVVHDEVLEALGGASR